MSGITEAAKLFCPHCGSLYAPVKTTQWNITEWKLTNEFGTVIFKSLLQSKVFDLLWRKQGIRGLTRQRIIDIIYMDDLDGGPEPDTITHEMMRMRKLLVIVGIFLKRGFSGGEGYSLVFLTPEQATSKVKEQSLGLGCKPQ